VADGKEPVTTRISWTSDAVINARPIHATAAIRLAGSRMRRMN